MSLTEITCLETKLKFQTSEKTGELISFVKISKDGRLWGSSTDSKKQMICVLSKDLKESGCIKPGVLYSVKLLKMNYKNGFVVKEATPILFHATVTTQIVSGQKYQIKVLFGNKSIYFNPFSGKDEHTTSLETVKNLLLSREDLDNKDNVVKELENQSLYLLKKLKDDGYSTAKTL